MAVPDKSGDGQVTGHAGSGEDLRLAAIVLSSEDAIYSCTLDGIIQTWNPAAERLYHYTPSEIIGAPIYLLIPEEKCLEFDQAVERVLEGSASKPIETTRLSKEGSIVYVSLNISAIRAVDGTLLGISVIARDITAHRRMEAAIAEKNARIGAYLETALDAIITIDHTGCVLEFNPAAERIFGFAKDEVVGYDMADFIIPERYRERHRQGMVRFLETGQEVLLNKRVEISAIKADGTEFPVELTITRVPGIMPPIFTGHIRDITDRKQAEQARQHLLDNLNNQRHWLEAILNLMPTPLLLLEPGTGRVLFANQAADRMAGGLFPRGNPVDDYNRIYPAYDEAGVQLPAERLPRVRAAKGEKLRNYQMDWEPPTGRRSLLINSDTLPPMFDYPETVMLVFEDITQEKNLEKRKDEFLSMVSHELKTPLTSIRGFTQLLQQKMARSGDEKVSDYLRRVILYTDKLTDLVDDLLDVSRIQSGRLQLRLEPFDFDALVAEVISDLQMTTRHSIRREGTSEAVMTGDRDRISQVLVNLISNAIKYSPQADTIIVRLSAEGGFVTVEVQDFGIGISKEQQEKLFQRYYRVEEMAHQFSGLGMGLYISAEIIARHGGSIWVESEPGQGSAFFVRLPVQPQ